MVDALTGIRRADTASGNPDGAGRPLTSAVNLGFPLVPILIPFQNDIGL